MSWSLKCWIKWLIHVNKLMEQIKHFSIWTIIFNWISQILSLFGVSCVTKGLSKMIDWLWTKIHVNKLNIYISDCVYKNFSNNFAFWCSLCDKSLSKFVEIFCWRFSIHWGLKRNLNKNCSRMCNVHWNNIKNVHSIWFSWCFDLAKLKKKPPATTKSKPFLNP